MNARFRPEGAVHSRSPARTSPKGNRVLMPGCTNQWMPGCRKSRTDERCRRERRTRPRNPRAGGGENCSPRPKAPVPATPLVSRSSVPSRRDRHTLCLCALGRRSGRLLRSTPVRFRRRGMFDTAPTSRDPLAAPRLARYVRPGRPRCKYPVRPLYFFPSAQCSVRSADGFLFSPSLPQRPPPCTSAAPSPGPRR